MDEKLLSSGLEDYIEAIYIADINKTQLKGAELARKLNISRASVSEALAKLVSAELIQYKSYGTISLTPKGQKEAIRVYHKHNVLKEFFETVLSLDSKQAEDVGCKLEHFISANILVKMREFTLYCLRHPEVIKEFIKESSQN